MSQISITINRVVCTDFVHFQFQRTTRVSGHRCALVPGQWSDTVGAAGSGARSCPFGDNHHPEHAADPAFAVIPASFDLPMAVSGVSAACSVPDQRGNSRLPAPCDVGAFKL